MQFSKFILTLLTILILPKFTFAAVDQSGFPARCSIYAACDADGSCIRAHLPTSAMFITQSVDGSLEVGSFASNDSRKLGFFKSLEDAEIHFEAGIVGGFGSFIVPNFEVADAVGYDLYSTSSNKRGFTYEKTKVSCSKMQPPKEDKP